MLAGGAEPEFCYPPGGGSAIKLPRPMPAKNHHVRQAAVSALRAWSKGHDYAETLIERHAHRRQLSSADRGLLQAILFGVLRHRRRNGYAPWQGRPIQPGHRGVSPGVPGHSKHSA